MQCTELFGNPDLLTISSRDKPDREGASISRIEIAFSSADTDCVAKAVRPTAAIRGVYSFPAADGSRVLR
jgi:hypothetical protein